MALNSRLVKSGKLDGRIKVGSRNWCQELKNLDSFRYIPSAEKPYTVRKEASRKKGKKDEYIPTDNQYWYAYRKVNGKLHKRYIGQDADLKIERLEEIAVQLNIPPEPRRTKKVTEESSVTNNDVLALQQRLEDLEAELLEASNKIKELTADNSTVRDELNELPNKLHNYSLPDYELLGDRYLKSLRLGKQASEYKKARAHIKKFIELVRGESKNT